MVSNDPFEGVSPLSNKERDLPEKVIAAMPQGVAMTVDQIAAAAGMEPPQVLKALQHLVHCNRVSRDDGKYRRLSRDEQG
jgi:predicted Rossmann fold nucleotide-binding protein DprA/Smf involved in DNA uptake